MLVFPDVITTGNANDFMPSYSLAKRKPIPALAEPFREYSATHENIAESVHV
jgi:hypothetical protein